VTVSPGRFNRAGPARGTMKGWKTSPRQRGIESTIGRVPMTPDGRFESELPRRRKPKLSAHSDRVGAQNGQKTKDGKRSARSSSTRVQRAVPSKKCPLCKKRKRNVPAHIAAVHKCRYCGKLERKLGKHIRRVHRGSATENGRREVGA
jgi:hypothetical protein